MEWGNEPISPADAASALQWWTEAGVDCLVDEIPHNWLRPAPKAAAHHQMSVSDEMPALALPQQLDAFTDYLRSDETLSFAAPRAPRVLPAGDPASGLMIVTDMPAAEDLADRTLLSGEAGLLFDRMLAAIGRDRGSIYLASLSCLRSPTGGFSGGSASACADLARHHISLAAPKAVLLLGDATTKALLALPVMKARGRWHELSTHSGNIAAMASFHPEYLLDQPTAKAAAWADLQMLAEGLKS